MLASGRLRWNELIPGCTRGETGAALSLISIQIGLLEPCKCRSTFALSVEDTGVKTYSALMFVRAKFFSTADLQLLLPVFTDTRFLVIPDKISFLSFLVGS